MLKDIHRANTPSDKTEALTKSMNMYIWAAGILNQLFIRDYYTQIKFTKKWSGRWQKSIFCNGSIWYSPFDLS